jgi:indolepyruvate ferredoxin oxidoreductase beta subunit
MDTAMRQQIIVSGLGGQGAVTLARVLGEAALALGLPVLTSETHGMAQRGGAVISMVKAGPYHGPLIPAGAADLGLFLSEATLPLHRFYLKPGGEALVNSAAPGDYRRVDAWGLARERGLPPVTANLILLGYAGGAGLLFCGVEVLREVVTATSPERFRAGNLAALETGMQAAAGGHLRG